MYHNYTNYTNQKGRWDKGQWDFRKAKGKVGKGTVKQFTDLDVYQKSLEANVFVCKELISAIKPAKKEKGVSKAQTEHAERMRDAVLETMTNCASSIPHLIAESHSKRFGTSVESLTILDTVMLKCNKMVVYLEQSRDLLALDIEQDRWEEQIKNYFYIRHKVLNLQRVWRKYITENQQNQKSNQ